MARLGLHANSTEGHVEGLVGAICEWVHQMMEIEKGGGMGAGSIPKAAWRVYAMMREENGNGYRNGINSV